MNGHLALFALSALLYDDGMLLEFGLLEISRVDELDNRIGTSHLNDTMRFIAHRGVDPDIVVIMTLGHPFGTFSPLGIGGTHGQRLA